MSRQLGTSEGEFTLGGGNPIGQAFGQAGGQAGPLGALPILTARAVSRVAPTSGSPSVTPRPGGGGGGGRSSGAYSEY